MTNPAEKIGQVDLKKSMQDLPHRFAIYSFPVQGFPTDFVECIEIDDAQRILKDSVGELLDAIIEEMERDKAPCAGDPNLMLGFEERYRNQTLTKQIERLKEARTSITNTSHE